MQPQYISLYMYVFMNWHKKSNAVFLSFLLLGIYVTAPSPSPDWVDKGSESRLNFSRSVGKISNTNKNPIVELKQPSYEECRDNTNNREICYPSTSRGGSFYHYNLIDGQELHNTDNRDCAITAFNLDSNKCIASGNRHNNESDSNQSPSFKSDREKSATTQSVSTDAHLQNEQIKNKTATKCKKRRPYIRSLFRNRGPSWSEEDAEMLKEDILGRTKGRKKRIIRKDIGIIARILGRPLEEVKKQIEICTKELLEGGNLLSKEQREVELLEYYEKLFTRKLAECETFSYKARGEMMSKKWGCKTEGAKIKLETLKSAYIALKETSTLENLRLLDTPKMKLLARILEEEENM